MGKTEMILIIRTVFDRDLSWFSKKLCIKSILLASTYSL